MILAEIHGKIPSRIEHKEDILTSNVFSFLKYSNRKYLKDYFSCLDIAVSIEDAEKAEFIFWPRYEEGTEPDVVIKCGDYYILIEAKLYSDFSIRIIDIETKEVEAQLEREARMGQLSARHTNKEFVLIAITSEYYKKENKYKKIENLGVRFIWTNWQFVANFLLNKIEDTNNHNDLLHLNDLYELLVHKRLRSFMNYSNLKFSTCHFNNLNIFYDRDSSLFKGEFTGFLKISANSPPIKSYIMLYHRSYFNLKSNSILYQTNKIFFDGIN
jgi:hypothetical protein